MHEGSMEKLLLEMQLDNKRDNMRTWMSIQQMMENNDTNKQSITQIKEEQTTLKNDLQQFQTVHKVTNDTVSTLTAKIDKMWKNQEIMVGIMERQATMIEHLQHQNEEYLSKSYRNNIIIQGLEIDDDDDHETINKKVTDFFSQTTKINKNIAIKSIVKMKKEGKVSATLQVTLENPKDKGIIFKNVKNLKDVKNNHDGYYSVNDHLTYERQEEQRRYRTIKKLNAGLPVTDRRM